ncbi:MAG: 2-polyprenyl-3-methyl-6-methoxy-1,4-benzoquinone monooxygenase [Gammaproteobacteria bacterium]
MQQRNYTRIDRVIIGAARALCGDARRGARAFPAQSAEPNLSARERRRSGRYMRVNHVGEVCAQALYRAQALTARDARLRDALRDAAAEENDHLAWCEQRLDELGARPSLLNPLWRLGAFTLGAAAGIAGDKWNLGFVAETERQVAAHLDGHLSKLPENDARSREVVAQMREDELAHADSATAAGAAELPQPVKRAMGLAARVMTSTAHWI